MREVEYSVTLVRDISGLAWARPLVDLIPDVSSLSSSDLPHLFELRVAGDLNGNVMDARYEHPTGVGDSSVDFAFLSGGNEWYLEVVSIGVSAAVRRVSWEHGPLFGSGLSSDAEDQRDTPQGELLLVQQNIGEKVRNRTKATKFPVVKPGRLHAILVDVRAFGLTGGDNWDYIEIAYGSRGIPNSLTHYRHWWRDADGTLSPISGLFDHNNSRQRASQFVRERVHFLGFCWDESYEPGSIGRNTFWCPNPYLFENESAARASLNAFPLAHHNVSEST